MTSVANMILLDRCGLVLYPPPPLPFLFPLLQLTGAVCTVCARACVCVCVCVRVCVCVCGCVATGQERVDPALVRLQVGHLQRDPRVNVPPRFRLRMCTVDMKDSPWLLASRV